MVNIFTKKYNLNYKSTDLEIMDEELDKLHTYRVIDPDIDCICMINKSTTLCSKCGIKLCAECANITTCFGKII